MRIQDLVVGRLYKVTSKKSLIGPEKEESLYMFLRARGKKALMLSLEGEYKSFEFDAIETPRADYLEIFTQETKDIVFPLMRKFILEYQKYDNVKYSKSEGFKSKGMTLRKLNSIQRDIEKLNITPFISKAVNSYFNFYKGIDVNFNSVESTMVNFLFIQEWKNSYKKLRGFSFNSKRFSNTKLDKYSQDTLILQHLYTNLCLKPNLKNIKAEWIDLLITKIYYNGYKDKNKNEVIKFLSKIKESCVSTFDNINMFDNTNMVDNSLQNQPINNLAINNSVKAYNNVQASTSTNAYNNVQTSVPTNTYNNVSNTTQAPEDFRTSIVKNAAVNKQSVAPTKTPGLNTVSFTDLIKENQYKINKLT